MRKASRFNFFLSKPRLGTQICEHPDGKNAFFFLFPVFFSSEHGERVVAWRLPTTQVKTASLGSGYELGLTVEAHGCTTPWVPKADGGGADWTGLAAAAYGLELEVRFCEQRTMQREVGSELHLLERRRR